MNRIVAKCFLIVISAFAFAMMPIATRTRAEEAAPAAARRTVTLKVMTINVRHNVDFWEERFPLIADEIVRLKPDLIGFQEMQVDIKQSKTLLKLIEERVGPDGLKYEKYEHVKTGKDMLWGEGVTIFSRYPMEEKGFADLDYGRPVVYARLKVDEGLTIDFYNTHLHNHGEDELRLSQARKLVAFEEKNDEGFLTFLTGDMNSTDDSRTIKYYIDSSFMDTYRAVHGDDTPAAGNTVPAILSKDNAPQNFTNRIDFVFVKTPPGYEGRVKVVDSVVCFRTPDERGLYPSDHLGVMTTLEISY
jgi:beta-glucosidase